MLILLLLNVLSLVFFSMLSLFASVISLIPFYTQINSVFANAIGFAKGAMVSLPYLSTVWNCFLIAITIEVLFIVGKFFLGSRFWTNTN